MRERGALLHVPVRSGQLSCERVALGVELGERGVRLGDRPLEGLVVARCDARGERLALVGRGGRGRRGAHHALALGDALLQPADGLLALLVRRAAVAQLVVPTLPLAVALRLGAGVLEVRGLGAGARLAHACLQTSAERLLQRLEACRVLGRGRVERDAVLRGEPAHLLLARAQRAVVRGTRREQRAVLADERVVLRRELVALVAPPLRECALLRKLRALRLELAREARERRGELLLGRLEQRRKVLAQRVAVLALEREALLERLGVRECLAEAHRGVVQLLIRRGLGRDAGVERLELARLGVERGAERADLVPSALGAVLVLL